MNLTYLILTKNNEKTLENTLNSLKNHPVIVGDTGSTDGTLAICRERQIQIVNLPFSNKAKAKNELTKFVNSGLVFHVEPWEILTNYQELEETSYKIKVFQDKIITTDLRIWPAKSNFSFENPLYPFVKGEAEVCDLILYSKGNQVPLEESLRVLEDWETENPRYHNVNYYKACLYLNHKQYDKFITESKKYLFKEKITNSALLLRYYLALILFYVKKDLKESVKNLSFCLFYRPEISELWCLLGDNYYKSNDYFKAREFYKNALETGKLRKYSEWPLEIEKCKAYPEKMIQSCTEMIEKTIYLKQII